MPWSVEERADLELAKGACVGKEALFMCGREARVVRVVEMRIEEEEWWALLEREGTGRVSRIGVSADGGFIRHITAEYWHFPEISERYFFEARFVETFRRERAKGLWGSE